MKSTPATSTCDHRYCRLMRYFGLTLATIAVFFLSREFVQATGAFWFMCLTAGVGFVTFFFSFWPSAHQRQAASRTAQRPERASHTRRVARRQVAPVPTRR